MLMELLGYEWWLVQNSHSRGGSRESMRVYFGIAWAERSSASLDPIGAEMCSNSAIIG